MKKFLLVSVQKILHWFTQRKGSVDPWGLSNIVVHTISN